MKLLYFWRKKFPKFIYDINYSNLVENPKPEIEKLLKQAQFSPLTVEQQTCILFAGVKGYLDKLDINRIGAFEKSLISALSQEGASMLTEISTKKAISPELDAQMHKFMANFVSSFK